MSREVLWGRSRMDVFFGEKSRTRKMHGGFIESFHNYHITRTNSGSSLIAVAIFSI